MSDSLVLPVTARIECLVQFLKSKPQYANLRSITDVTSVIEFLKYSLPEAVCPQEVDTEIWLIKWIKNARNFVYNKRLDSQFDEYFLSHIRQYSISQSSYSLYIILTFVSLIQIEISKIAEYDTRQLFIEFKGEGVDIKKYIEKIIDAEFDRFMLFPKEEILDSAYIYINGNADETCSNLTHSVASDYGDPMNGQDDHECQNCLLQSDRTRTIENLLGVCDDLQLEADALRRDKDISEVKYDSMLHAIKRQLAITENDILAGVSRVATELSSVTYTNMTQSHSIEIMKQELGIKSDEIIYVFDENTNMRHELDQAKLTISKYEMEIENLSRQISHEDTIRSMIKDNIKYNALEKRSMLLVQENAKLKKSLQESELLNVQNINNDTIGSIKLNFKQELTELQVRYDEISEKNRKLESECTDIRIQLSLAQEERSQFEILYDEQIETNLNVKRELMELSDTNNSNIHQLKGIQMKNDLLNQDMEQLEKDLVEKDRIISDQREAICSFRVDGSNTATDEEIHRQNTELQELVDSLRAKMLEYSAEATETGVSSAEVNQLKSNIEEKEKHIEQLKISLDEEKLKSSRLENKISRLEKQVADISNDAESKGSNVFELNKKLQLIEQQLASEKTVSEKLRTEQNNLKETLSKEKRITELEVSKVAKLEKALESVIAQIQSSQMCNKEREKSLTLQKEFDRLKTHIKDLEATKNATTALPLDSNNEMRLTQSLEKLKAQLRSKDIEIAERTLELSMRSNALLTLQAEKGEYLLEVTKLRKGMDEAKNKFDMATIDHRDAIDNNSIHYKRSSMDMVGRSVKRYKAETDENTPKSTPNKYIISDENTPKSTPNKCIISDRDSKKVIDDDSNNVPHDRLDSSTEGTIISDTNVTSGIMNKDSNMHNTTISGNTSMRIGTNQKATNDILQSTITDDEKRKRRIHLLRR